MHERSSDAVKRYQGLLVPLSCSMASLPEQLAEFFCLQQESIHYREDHHQLEAAFPEPEPGAFQGQLGPGVAEGRFHLPPSGIAKDHAPGLVDMLHGQVGDKVQGRMSLAGPKDNERELSARPPGVKDCLVVKAHVALLPAGRILDQALGKAALAPDQLPAGKLPALLSTSAYVLFQRRMKC